MIELPETEIEWINTTALNNDVEVERVREMFEKEYTELEGMGLKDVPGGEVTILKAVRNIVAGNLLANASVPSTKLYSIPIGNYMPATTFKGDPKVDIVGIVSDGGAPEFGLMTAWNEDVQKLNDITPFVPVQTDFTHYANDKIPGQYNITVRNETDFTAKTDMPSMPSDPKEIENEVIKSLGAYEKVTIVEAPGKPSSKIAVEGRRPYVNNLDIKCIEATIKDYNNGVWDGGVEWGSYQLFDGSILGHENTFFSGQVDPNYAKRVGAGIGSLCNFYGTITMNTKGVTRLNVFYVQPLLLKPMGDEVQVKRDAPQGGQSQQPKVPQIVTVHGDGAE